MFSTQVAASDAIVTAPDFGLCYAHPATGRTVRLRTDADWTYAFAQGRAAGSLCLLVDLPHGRVRPHAEPSPPGHRRQRTSILARVDPPQRVDWPRATRGYTVDAHAYALDPRRPRPEAPPLPAKPVSKKERRRRIANELAGRLCRAPPV